MLPDSRHSSDLIRSARTPVLRFRRKPSLVTPLETFNGIEWQVSNSP